MDLKFDFILLCCTSLGFYCGWIIDRDALIEKKTLALGFLHNKLEELKTFLENFKKS